MNKKILGLAIAMGGLVVSSASQAYVLIDGFGDSMPDTSAPASGTTALTDSDFSSTRDWVITNSGGTASLIFTNGIMGISTGFGAQSDTALSYAGSGMDFTAMEAQGVTAPFESIVLELLSIDQGGVNITVTVDGASVTKNNIITTGPIVFGFSDFGGVDFTNVTSMQFDIHNNTAVDATFDALGVYGKQYQAPPAVPEPAALALLGLGLAGFGFGRRKVAS